MSRTFMDILYDLDEITRELNEKIFNEVVAKPKASEWVPVTERLPETEEDFLCIDADEEYEVGCYSLQFKHFFFNSCSLIGKPIAWMELPPAYKEEMERSE